MQNGMQFLWWMGGQVKGTVKPLSGLKITMKYYKITKTNQITQLLALVQCWASIHC